MKKVELWLVRGVCLMQGNRKHPRPVEPTVLHGVVRSEGQRPLFQPFSHTLRRYPRRCEQTVIKVAVQCCPFSTRPCGGSSEYLLPSGQTGSIRLPLTKRRPFAEDMATPVHRPPFPVSPTTQAAKPVFRGFSAPGRGNLRLGAENPVHSHPPASTGHPERVGLRATGHLGREPGLG